MIRTEWFQQPSDYVTEYIIYLSVMPVGCTELDMMGPVMLNGSARSYMFENVEEFSEVTITIVAWNSAGNSTANASNMTLSAGMLLISLDM